MKNIIFGIMLLSVNLLGQSLEKKCYNERIVNGGAEKIGEYNLVEYSVKLENGEALYQIMDKVDYDVPYSKLEVFENGNSVLISAFYGTLTFINNNGTKGKSIKIKENLKVEYERNIQSVVDKKSVLILFQELNDKFSTIQKYDEDGTLQLELEIPITDIGGIAFSESLNQIFISHFNWSDSGELEKKVTILNSNGEILKSIKATFEKGFFTNDDQFIGFANKSIFLFNTNSKEVMFNEKLNSTKVVLDVSYSNREIIIALSNNPKLENGEWYYSNATIQKVSLAGDVLNEIDFRTDLFVNYKLEKKGNSISFIADKRSLEIK
jgi:hypothetical protein